ncbi:hypothetical protein [Qipengyuania sp. NPDC077563]|uniref:hypothetical protein n=1 Tax=Qipengyuania sp. NPDC077563 TaxID=3364497 RepID=UPI00384CA7A5
MRFTPQMLGAVAVIAMAGAVSGATIGESPILTRTHADSVPQSAVVSTSNAALARKDSPPNHYPLETENGTIEVAELALHGRLRDRGGKMWWQDRDDRELVATDDEYDFYRTASPERIAHEERLLAFTGARAERSEFGDEHQEPTRMMTRAEAPMALAEPAELDTRNGPSSAGNAKTINVAGVLALRD